MFLKNFSLNLFLNLFLPKIPLHRNENLTPFFIIGSGRSGNTLLRRILHAHSRIFIPPETYVLGHAIKLFKRIRHKEWPFVVKSILKKLESYPEFKAFGFDSLDELIFEIYRCPSNNQSLAYILDRFYRYYGEFHGLGGDIWGDKTPINVFFLNKIQSVFPSARYIHIIRDGYDVIASYVTAGRYKDYCSAAKRWKRSIIAARKFGDIYPNQYIEIKYEELVSTPKNIINPLCNFLNINFEEEMLHSEKVSHQLLDVDIYDHYKNVKKPVTNLHVGKGREKLNRKDKDMLWKIIGNEMVKLGYPK